MFRSGSSSVPLASGLESGGTSSGPSWPSLALTAGCVRARARTRRRGRVSGGEGVSACAARRRREAHGLFELAPPRSSAQGAGPSRAPTAIVSCMSERGRRHRPVPFEMSITRWALSENREEVQ